MGIVVEIGKTSGLLKKNPYFENGVLIGEGQLVSAIRRAEKDFRKNEIWAGKVTPETPMLEQAILINGIVNIRSKEYVLAPNLAAKSSRVYIQGPKEYEGSNLNFDYFLKKSLELRAGAFNDKSEMPQVLNIPFRSIISARMLGEFERDEAFVYWNTYYPLNLDL